MQTNQSLPGGLTIAGPATNEAATILTPGALAFVAALHRAFEPTRAQLLHRRAQRQAEIDAGRLPDFLPETAGVRAASWTIAPVPADLQDRRVEITGPAGDRKMVINALNSGASAFMADFEDANSPTWANCVGGQANLRDAVRQTIGFTGPDGRAYALNDKTATLLARPRGWHLTEKHALAADGAPVSASLFDFGLYVFHNARELLARGSGPYFYLPKLESHGEARLWNDVFVFAENELGLPPGAIKATVLIETILAAFEMDEILYELRAHAAGLNCGRWDYIFSYIKKLRSQPDVIVPDRAQVTMTAPFLRAYSLLAIKTCHRRGAHCIGGMTAQIPIKNDSSANEAALAKVRADKEREAGDGHDGTWVAHPALVPVAREIFDRHLPGPNQVDRQRGDVSVCAADLLAVPDGTITLAGLRTNLSVGVQYLEAWLRGVGAVPVFHLMEDVATAEISRAQAWQWLHHPKGVLDDGRKITPDLFRQTLAEEIAAMRASVGDARFIAGKYDEAAQLFATMTLADDFVEFLTLPAYERLD